jgi:hypothetical protein
METIDTEWESFLENDNIGYNKIDENHENHLDDVFLRNSLKEDNIPKCSEIYISTKTKISYLNVKEIDIKNIFWKIPITEYYMPQEGVIKKQIKYSTNNKNDIDEIEDQLKNIKFYDQQIIEHIDNPEGRIKFKDQRKISIGICKKDILSYRSKKKRAFFNCFVLILRLKKKDEFKEMHVKVFNTGKMEIPGIQDDEMLNNVLNKIVCILKPFISNDLDFISNKTETVLINSNFNCGYYIDRDKLHDILKYKYRINSNYDACSYPGIQSKFYYDNTKIEQDGQQPNHKDYYQVSFMIFRTGSVLIVGKCDEEILYEIYNFIKKIFKNEYKQIVTINFDNNNNNNNKKNKKIVKKIVYFDVK